MLHVNINRTALSKNRPAIAVQNQRTEEVENHRRMDIARDGEILVSLIQDDDGHAFVLVNDELSDIMFDAT